MMNVSENRRVMVDSQVRPSDVTKYPVIAAMLAVPREEFVPGSHRSVAYADGDIAIAPGRVVLAPRTLAKMLDALDVSGGELVLDLACGLGYSTALLARIAEAVVGVEEEHSFAGHAQGALAERGVDNAAVIEAPLLQGAPEHGPYDAVMVQGAVEALPQAILDQVKDGGRIVAIFAEGKAGQARLGIKTGETVSWRHLFDATAPVLPGFTHAPAFEL